MPLGFFYFISADTDTLPLLVKQALVILFSAFIKLKSGEFQKRNFAKRPRVKQEKQERKHENIHKCASKPHQTNIVQILDPSVANPWQVFKLSLNLNPIQGPILIFLPSHAPSNRVHVQTEQITCKNQWVLQVLGKTIKFSLRVHHHRKKLFREIFTFLPLSKDKIHGEVFPFIYGKVHPQTFSILIEVAVFPCVY